MGMTSVFAYGSNMHLEDLQRWLREHGYRHDPLVTMPATLTEHALRWNYLSPVRQGGAANVVPHPHDDVRGLLLRVPVPLLEAFDRKEGHPHRYLREELHVHTPEGKQLAWVYRVTHAYRREDFTPPTREYLLLMVEAARELGLAPSYIQWLESLPVF